MYTLLGMVGPDQESGIEGESSGFIARIVI